jgi:hypothetical protein
MEAKEIFKPYAKATLVLKDQFLSIEKQYNSEKDNKKKKLLKKQMGTFKSLINENFRQTGDFVPADASKKALEYCAVLATASNSPKDIFKLGWNDQLAFEGQRNRTECKLKYEHKIPVKQLVDKLINAKSYNDALAIFMSQEIVWVTNEEEARLPRSNRPNPDEEYRKAGISVIKNPNLPGHLHLK